MFNRILADVIKRKLGETVEAEVALGVQPAPAADVEWLLAEVNKAAHGKVRGFMCLVVTDTDHEERGRGIDIGCYALGTPVVLDGALYLLAVQVAMESAKAAAEPQTAVNAAAGVH